MARYYAQITGSANITTNFNPNTVWSNNNYLKLEYNGDITTSAGGICPWFAGQSPWFCLVQDSLTSSQNKQYLNIGSSVYIGTGYSWNTEGFSYTTVITFNNSNISMVKGEQSYSGTFSGNIPSNNLGFFTNYANNLQMDFYELKVYGYGNELLFDFVPDYSGTTKGIRDKVSNGFTAATNQNLISLVALSTFYVDTTEITADSTGTSTSVTITADEELTWTASTSDSWITLTNPTGSGNGSFSVTVSSNSEHSAKTGTITVTSSESDTISITVSQEKAPVLISQKPLYRSGDEVVKMYRSGELIYIKVNPQTEPPEPPTPTGYSNMYLTMEIISAGNLKWYAQNGSYTKTIEYKKNDGEWTQITSSNAGTLIPVAVGDIVQLKGDNAQYAPQDGRCSCWCGTTASYKVYGNIMSLIDSTGFATLSSFTQPNVFMNFFNSGGCIDAENLILPATALTNYCYQGMLAQSNNLQVGPLLPAETLVTGCYAYLFYHSNQMNNIRCLATNISASNCLQGWTNSVQTSSGTFYKNPNMSSWGRGDSAVPNNWTIANYTG